MKIHLFVLLLPVFAVCTLFANETYQIQSQSPDGSGKILPSGVIELKRGAEKKAYMLRAFCDISVLPGRQYLWTYESKTDTGDSVAGIVIPGKEENGTIKWRNSPIFYAPQIRTKKWKTTKFLISVPEDVNKLRLDFRLNGTNVLAQIRNFSIQETGRPSLVRLKPTGAEFCVDGKLDDAIWKNAVVFSPFRPLSQKAAPLPVPSEARLAVSDNALCISYRLTEPEMAKMLVIHPQAGKSLAISAGDCVETFLSTDRQSFSHLLVNPDGLRHWEQYTYGKALPNWYPGNNSIARPDSEWEAKTLRSGNEWTVELRIPLKAVFDTNPYGKTSLFVNFTRHRMVRGEENNTFMPLSGPTYARPMEFLALELELPSRPNLKEGNDFFLNPIFTNQLGVPTLFLSGKPVFLQTTQERVYLQKNRKPAVSSQFEGITQELFHSLSGNQTVPSVEFRKRKLPSQNQISSGERAKLMSPEAFHLRLTKSGSAVISAPEKDGALRGMATLLMLCDGASLSGKEFLPELELFDAPRMTFRGWLVATGTKTEFRHMIETAFRLRLNKILLPLDSWGGPTRFPFTSYPIGGKEFSKDDWRELFAFSRSLGVEPIPYFASWGRVQYLRNIKDGTSYFIEDRNHHQSGYRNLNTANPDAKKIMLALQREILETLSPSGFCIGLDETHFGRMNGTPESKALNWKDSDWFVDSLLASWNLFQKHNVKTYLWGDMLDPKQNGKYLDMSGDKLMARLPKKGIAILDWKYEGKFDHAVDFPSVGMFCKTGFETIGAPWFRENNVSRLAASVARQNAAGLCQTSWSDTRLDRMRPEMMRALALSAWFSWSPENCSLNSISHIPELLTRCAAKTQLTADLSRSVRLTVPQKDLTTGAKLMKKTQFPRGTSTKVLETEALKPFFFRDSEGNPAALLCHGNSLSASELLRNGTFKDSTREWEVQNGGNGLISVQNRVVSCKVAPAKIFSRLYQDIALNPAARYTVRFRGRSKNSARQCFWFYPGKTNLKWNESGAKFFSMENPEWKTHEIPLPPGLSDIRLCFGATGTDAGTAEFSQIELISNIPEKKQESMTIPVNATIRTLTLLAAVNSQPFQFDMQRDAKTFGAILAGKIQVKYASGKRLELPLRFREEVTALNDPYLPRRACPGVFGTVDHRVFLNIPVWQWKNPHPDDRIESLCLTGGNSDSASLLVFGIARDRQE